MNVPDAAIEAAAEALYNRFAKGRNVLAWRRQDGDARQAWLNDARAALVAADRPYREAIAQEVECSCGIPDCRVHAHAARIVRGGDA